jgi:hypothetical protein
MMAEQPVYLDDEVQILEAPRAAAAARGVLSFLN